MKTLMLGILLFGSLLAQEVVELKLPNTNKVTIKLMFKNGSVCDPAGKEGLMYLTSALITQGGTGDLTYADIQNKIYPWAAGYSSSVDKEVSIFTFEVHQDFLNDFYPILKGLILNPSFSQNDFDRVKRNQQNYVDQVIRASSDEEYSKKALEDFLFRGTKYQHMVQGKTESVKAITLEDVKNHYKNFFTKNNLMIGIAGNYSSAFLSTLKNDLQNLSAVKPVLPAQTQPKAPMGINVDIILKDNAFGSA
ncbi:MAG: insulinase family protein, partial [Ignavibacteria bacterium]|nr:insulinase family protein [Ignavibacteria bacterium]